MRPTPSFRLGFSALTRRMSATASTTREDLPPSSIPIFTAVHEYRAWRQKAFDEKRSVGFVATMGALHDGHLSLVKRSLEANDLTVLSIFVNPAQFAPHEDLATYPRTLPHDLAMLSSVSHSVPVSNTDLPSALRTPSALFLPSVKEMYPSGISQDISNQTGTFVEVKGYGEQMEGKSRPTFFRGVATVPTNAYFGQKDIQQAILLRRLVTDLHMSQPSPSHLHIVPTARDPRTGLALSSRNTYLTLAEREKAQSFYAALKEGAKAWDAGESKAECVRRAVDVLVDAGARPQMSEADSEARGKEVGDDGEGEPEVIIKVDYIGLNDASSFAMLSDGETRLSWGGGPVILNGAIWIGRTRLIDNLVLGDARQVLME
ncbi:hypothetical protein EW146_g5212 [Bondarzewia mesenterica]|uniref:Pantoate--beta-alanine ligase n=1 Tax=Bondarzewia mesenterica TaxID=1095465 RepID=A0A4S4LS57_9AGAM|nr:hypothetical protein EW146_g5212 [Bondarzewia mesenterica]